MTENKLNELKDQLRTYEDLLAQEENSGAHYTLNVIGYKAMIEHIKQKIQEAENPLT